MGNRTTTATYDVRYLIAGLLALLLVVAIGVPLYLAGTPNLRASSRGAADGPTATLPALALRPSTAVPSPALPAIAASAPAATPIGASPADSPLARAVNAVIDGNDGIYGVVIATPGEPPRYALNADVPFVAASLYKLVLLADIYDGIERGLVDPELELPILPEYYPSEDEPPDSYFDPFAAPDAVALDEAMFAAGAYSSNVAARALLSLTDEASLRATAVSLGMTESYFFVDPRDLDGWPPPATPGASAARVAEAVRFAEEQADAGPVMLTTPRDMARFFDRLLAGEVVNQAASDAILAILEQQAVDDRFPCLLPPGARIAHKTGNLDHVVHDVGVVWNGNRPTILVAMVEDAQDDATAAAVIQRLALIAYDAGDDPLEAIATPARPTCGAVDETASDEEAAVDATDPDAATGVGGGVPPAYAGAAGGEPAAPAPADQSPTAEGDAADN